jgi:hypothetical protein
MAFYGDGEINYFLKYGAIMQQITHWESSEPYLEQCSGK